MKAGIMQPYFFPYIGYWQLINAVDTYVIYDDVNYIQRGWINRNKILINGEAHFLTLPLEHASQTKKINEIQMSDFEKNRKRLLNTIRLAYSKAPYFSGIYKLIERIFDTDDMSLSHFLIKQILLIAEHLDMSTNFIISSELVKNCDLRGEEKILDICKDIGATYYINAIGGQELYFREHFERKGLRLGFLRSEEILYTQFPKNFFIGNLSIIDVLMFNSKKQVCDFLMRYQIE